MRKYIGVLFVLAILIGCSEEKKEDVVDKLPENYDSIFTPYLAIVDALINDDYNQARLVGKQLSEAEKDTGVKLALVRMGQLMNEASSLYDQRTILEQLGMVIPLYLEQSIVNDYPIFKFKCKNEFDGKEVVWFGLSKNTKNPFIGDNSDECIELVETIEPVIVK